MALTLGDNFSYQGKKPLDGRIKYDTVAAMKAVADATMYNGCLAYCEATDKTYQWKSSNTVDENLGKWREFETGGGTEYTAGNGIEIDGDEIAVDEMDSTDFGEFKTPSYSGGNCNPTGTIINFFGNYAPEGYLKCDGTVYNIADYPRLANFFLVQFGSVNYCGGNGTTTFAVPDLRGEFLRGTGTNGHSGNGNGADVGVHQDGTAIANIATNEATNVGLYIEQQTTSNADNLIRNYDSIAATGSHYTHVFERRATTTRDSGTYRFAVRPTNTSVLYCIKD